MNLFQEAWQENRPLIRMLIGDAYTFVAIWVIMFFVHILSVYMPVGGPVGEILVGIHEYGLEANYASITLMTLYDIWKFKVTGGHKS